MYYFYDGTFFGFLTLVYEIFLIGNFDIFVLKNYEKGLFMGTDIHTDNEKAKKSL